MCRVRPLFLGAFAKSQNATISFVVSVRLSAWNNSAPTGRILIKFGIRDFFENLSIKVKAHETPTRILGTLHEDVFIFMTISLQILLRMRNISDKSCRENKNTYFMFNNFFSKIVPFMR